MSDETKNTSRRPFGMSRKVAAETLTLIINAFGLVAALAWNDAIQKLIARFFHNNGSLISAFIYAIIVTALIVILTSRLAKIKDRMGD